MRAGTTFLAILSLSFAKPPLGLRMAEMVEGVRCVMAAQRYLACRFLLMASSRYCLKSDALRMIQFVTSLAKRGKIYV